jgi:hypothetical protein
MKQNNKLTAFTLWVNRSVGLLVVLLIFFLQPIMDWYCQFRVLTGAEQTAITVAFYCCVVVIGIALWNMDRLLTDILAEQVFTRKNVIRIRRIQWCCGGVSLICIPASFAYLPLIFMVIVMAFLCLAVSVLSRVMDAAVTIREENDLTI